MKILLAIGAGSFIGGVCRFLFSQFIQTKFPSSFPVGTFAVNVIGCLFIGVVYGLFLKNSLSNEWKLFLATGILGGFTTFSAFSYETIELLKTGRITFAVLYVIASILLGLTATFIGWQITK